jgi:hypothetical protein
MATMSPIGVTRFRSGTLAGYRRASPGLADQGEMRADPIGIGGPQGGIQREGFLPVPAGLLPVSGSITGPAEAVMSPRLLVAIADLSRQVECGGVPGAGVVKAAHPEQALAQAVERLRLTGAVTGLVEGDQGLLMVRDRPRAVPQLHVGVTKAGERVADTVQIADLAEQSQSPLLVGEGLLIAPQHSGSARIAAPHGPDGRAGRVIF